MKVDTFEESLKNFEDFEFSPVSLEDGFVNSGFEPEESGKCAENEKEGSNTLAGDKSVESEVNIDVEAIQFGIFGVEDGDGDEINKAEDNFGKVGDGMRENPCADLSFLSEIFAWWLNPLFKIGYQRDLETSDLYRVLPEDRSEALGDLLEEKWEEELKRSKLNKKKPSLHRALARGFGGPFMLYGVFACIEECFTRIAQPLCLGYLIRYFTLGYESAMWEAYLYAGGVVFGSAFYTFTHHPYFFGVQYTGMKLRVASCSLIYRKALRLSKAALGQSTIGQMVNLLSNDVNRFDSSVLFMHYLWVAPLQTMITLAILWHELGVSCLVGLTLLVLFVPFQAWIGRVFSRCRVKTAGRTDERIRLMNEILSGMRVIKMYAWEKPFASIIELCRKKEVDIIRQTAYYRSLNMSLFYTSSKVILFLTFLTYVLTGNVLTAEKVFLTVSLYNNVRLGMTLFFPSGISLVAEMDVSIKRLQKFLELEERDDSKIPRPLPKTKEALITVDSITARWSANTEDNTLTNVSATVKDGELLAVIGPVGAGKGSLLQAILGELPVTSGTVQVEGKVAYASQEPWVFGGSIRQNIIFGEKFNQKRYQQVLKACALDKDFLRFPYGDESLVGDRGVSLSGGQKARVSLARALYMDADIYLLDDPLSAVDAHVGRHLFDESIMGFLKGKLRILVTHQLQYLQEANKILILKEGRVSGTGSYSELCAQGIDFGQLVAVKEEEADNSGDESEEDLTQYTDHQNSVSVESFRSITGSFSSSRKSPIKSIQNGSLRHRGSLSKSCKEEKKDGPKQAEEMRTRGSVGLSIYRQYFGAGGGFCMNMFLIIANILTQVVFSGSDYWLTYWTNSEEYSARQRLADANRTESLALNESDGALYNLTLPGHFHVDQMTNVYVYTALIVSLFILSMGRTVAFFILCMKASVRLHNRMFESIIRAPIRFFDINPVGRTLNRFSKDIGSMDESLPMAFFDVYTIFLTTIGLFALIGIVNPWLLLPTLFLAVLFVYLRRFYLATARDIKRLEGITRSPVFSHLSASLVGLTTVRAHGAQESFKREFDLHQDMHSSSWYLFLATTRWFGIWLDWISVIYVAAVTIGVMVLSDSLAGGDVGLVISSAMLMTGMFQWGVRQSAEVENQMTSVERVLEYAKLEPEAPLEIEGQKPPPSWPQKGTISLERVFLRYDVTEPYVLRGLSCDIREKEKVGIVGRTGAGKSTLITALFRLAEHEGAIKVDGINIKETGLHDLRSKISIIPQDPFLFTGTLRRNLDPFGDYKDDQLWLAIEEVKLKDAVQDMNGGLEAQMSEGGSNLSVGQRQLVCLARAILKRNKILILDEATANVDPRTDELIQETIRVKFKDCTVLTIAHRLNTIMDSDRVMVMDAGMLREFDEPYLLLQRTDGVFYGLVQQAGKDTAEMLSEIANQAARNRKAEKRLEDSGEYLSAIEEAPRAQSEEADALSTRSASISGTSL